MIKTPNRCASGKSAENARGRTALERPSGRDIGSSSQVDGNVGSVGNQAMQGRARSADDALRALQVSGVLQAKLRVGSVTDPAEHEADRMAAAALNGGSVGKCGCATEATVRRKPKEGGMRPAAAGATENLGLNGGRHLEHRDRRFFETRMHSDFSSVRVHDDASAGHAADALGARAFTVGSDVVFGRGEYQPHTESGRQLLAHELAHVAQGEREIVRREAQPSAATKTPEQDPANPTILDLKGTLGERNHAFKQLVETTAVHRLLANQRNLKKWELLVQRAIPAGDIAAVGLQQSGGAGAYFELQDIQDPALRQLRATQVLGENRACTGCHIEKEIYATRGERKVQSLMRWVSPNEIRMNFQTARAYRNPLPGQFTGLSTVDFAKPVPTTYSPVAGTAEAQLNKLFPDPSAARASLMRIQPIVTTLGPYGYNVLDTDILPLMLAGKSDAVRCEITAAIERRYADFGTLIGKIQGGEVGWEHFAPIIRSLLPLTDAEVRAAIQKEMDDHSFWAKVESAVVGVLSVAALILTIFPPTSALGLAALASLDLTLASYGINKGEEMIRVGEIYGLGRGAHDVFTPEQQAAADAMVLGGWVSMIGGILQGVGGLARVNQIARMSPQVLLATSSAGAVGRIIQRGDYVMTVAADGTMYVTVASRPDLLIMARGNTATLYQVIEGGLRKVATATLPGDIATPAAAPLLLSAGTEAGAASTALVPVQPAPLTLFPRTMASAGDLGTAASSGQRVLITPPPRVLLQLGPGNPTTLTWDQISRMRQPLLWEQREIYMQELYGAPGQQHFPVPNTGGRFVDVPAQLPSGQLFAGEVKSYTRWITVEGQAQRNTVELTPRIQEQINRDVWLRDNYPGYDPRWMFTDAPPAAALRQALRDAKIAFIEYLL